MVQWGCVQLLEIVFNAETMSHSPHSMSALILTQFPQRSAAPHSGWSVGRPLQTISLCLPSTNKCRSPSLVTRRPADRPTCRLHMLMLAVFCWPLWCSWCRRRCQYLLWDWARMSHRLGKTVHFSGFSVVRATSCWVKQKVEWLMNETSFQQLTENRNAGPGTNVELNYKVHMDKPQWPSLIKVQLLL